MYSDPVCRSSLRKRVSRSSTAPPRSAAGSFGRSAGSRHRPSVRCGLKSRRSGGKPLDVNAGNFVRSLVWAVPAILIALVAGRSIQVTGSGIVLAIASGALASGLGYAIWYAALKGLSGIQSAVVQLSVPPIAALGGVLFLGEHLSPWLAACGTAILAGIALATTARK